MENGQNDVAEQMIAREFIKSSHFGSGTSTPTNNSQSRNPSFGANSNLLCQNCKQQNLKDQYNQFFKILLIGPPYSGKSSIVRQYCTRDFIQEYESTFGMLNQMKNVIANELIVQLSIWDTPSDELYLPQIHSQVANANAVLFVYDATDANSVKKVTALIDELAPSAGPNAILFAVANKDDSDMRRKELKYVAKEVLKKHNLNFAKTSARSSRRTNQLFEWCIDLLVEKQAKLAEENLNRNLMTIVDKQNLDEDDNGVTSNYVDDSDDETDSLQSRIKDIYYSIGQLQKSCSSLNSELDKTERYRTVIQPMFKEDEANKIRERINFIKENPPILK